MNCRKQDYRLLMLQTGQKEAVRLPNYGPKQHHAYGRREPDDTFNHGNSRKRGRGCHTPTVPFKGPIEGYAVALRQENLGDEPKKANVNGKLDPLSTAKTKRHYRQLKQL